MPDGEEYTGKPLELDGKVSSWLDEEETGTAWLELEGAS
jgi:hypothetical protein